MLNTLLFVHLVIALLLVVVILLQKTSTDGLSGIGGGAGNTGVMTARSAANFLVKTTAILAAAFFINSLILANLSTKQHDKLTSKIDLLQQSDKEPNNETLNIEEQNIPIAK